jgi:hypothetical protein
VGAVRLGRRRAADRSPDEPASVISCVLDADSGWHRQPSVDPNSSSA